MLEYLIQTAVPEAYFPPNADTPSEYASVVRVGMIGGDTVLNIMHEEDPTKAGDSLIGGWGPDGVAITPLDVDRYTQLRPLGNHPPRDVYDENGNVTGQTRGGDATGPLVTHGFFGWGLNRTQSLRQLEGTAQAPRAYPADNDPFGIQVRHKYFGGNANPAWDGWGWRAEIIGVAQSRDPSARAIGVYRDPDCEVYWYTTGAFTEQESEWQTDENGDPIQVWATEYNPGLLGEAQPTPPDVHHAVLLGAAQEGYATLRGGEETNVAEHLFWENTQPGPGGAQWQSTGSVVTGIVGAAVYNVTTTVPFESMATDTPLRIGGVETTFDSVFTAGEPGIITVGDHNPNAVGEEIWAYL